jgi:hypothetical protein
MRIDELIYSISYPRSFTRVLHYQNRVLPTVSHCERSIRLIPGMWSNWRYSRGYIPLENAPSLMAPFFTHRLLRYFTTKLKKQRLWTIDTVLTYRLQTAVSWLIRLGCEWVSEWASVWVGVWVNEWVWLWLKLYLRLLYQAARTISHALHRTDLSRSRQLNNTICASVRRSYEVQSEVRCSTSKAQELEI